jgi:ABC-type multidrug transport system fused ATPase/permease subunit
VGRPRYWYVLSAAITIRFSRKCFQMALLGEMTLLDGRIIMCKDPSTVDEFGLMHSISYAAQAPWLQHRSIKDNILFGYPPDEERYQAVIDACALRPDLEVLEDGDATEIGARGVSLSGGQKARVALARAVYARTRYVLLDDPLSAVVGFFLVYIHIAVSDDYIG